MLRRKDVRGLTTIEYALLLPVILACIFLVIDVFLILYQKSLIQTYTENMAQTLARQWGYMPLPLEESRTGVYQKNTYESREVYWHIKLWENRGKAEEAERYIKEEIKKQRFLKFYAPPDTRKNDGSRQNALEPEVDVVYKAGFPSTLSISVKSYFHLPGANIIKAIGLGELLTIKGYATAHVYDTKDMINNTDYVLQLLRKTAVYQKFIEKIAPLKQNIEKFIGKKD
jgi:hypothetical protein